MQIKTRGHDVYAIFNKSYSTFALFEGRDSGTKELLPYQVSAKYKLKQEDLKLVRLRKCPLGEKVEGRCEYVIIQHSFIFLIILLLSEAIMSRSQSGTPH